MSSTPVFQNLGDIYHFDFREEQIKVKASHLRDLPEGPKAEIRISSYRSGEENLVHYANLNLLSTRGRKDISKQAASRINSVDWDGLLECVCAWIIEGYREGEPMQKAGNVRDSSPVEYTLYPVMVEGEPNILYGYGGTGKSYLACLWGLLIQTGRSRLGLKPMEGNVLYLDYESSFRELNKRIIELKNGMNLPPETELYYRRCHQPVADDVETIKGIILENGISLVIIDSIGPACGGEPETADSALRYFKALRSLETTTLSISHRTKKEEAKGPFGSVYWYNLARYVWTVELGDISQQNKLTVTLQHEKSNVARRFNPVGLEFTFHPDGQTTTVDKIDVDKLPTLMENLPIKDQIKRVLSRHGELTEKEIAGMIPGYKRKGVSPNTVRATCSRDEKLFEKVNGKWRLKAFDL